MNLTEALAQSKKAPGTACAIGLLLADLKAEDAKALRAALAMPSSDVPHVQIMRALALLGKKVSDFSISRHRHGECRCGS